MMRSSVKHKIKVYALSVALALAVGGLAALLTGGGMRAYASLAQPVLAPPGWLFPVVWTVLYILMGLSAGMIYLSDDDCRRDALRVYALQLFLNFGWTILFFGFSLRFAAFIWLVLLWAAIAGTALLFRFISKPAGWLMLPYLAWVTFAGYLNLGVYILNR